MRLQLIEEIDANLSGEVVVADTGSAEVGLARPGTASRALGPVRDAQQRLQHLRDLAIL